MKSRSAKRSTHSHPRSKSSARLIIGAPAQYPDISWATGFWAPDPAAFLDLNGERYLILRDLEVDRARKNRRLKKVYPSSDLEREVRAHRMKASPKNASNGIRIGWADMVDHLLKDHGVKTLVVPHDLGAAFADGLRERGYRLELKDPPFYEQRAIKTSKEIDAVRKVMAVTEAAVKRAVETIRKSKIQGNRLVYRGSTLTSESLRQQIHLDLMAGDCVADLNSIVACGEHAADPHEVGSGPLRPNQPIILDVFPRSLTTGYYGDLTRTVVRGKAPAKLRRMYDAVYRAVQVAAKMYKPGVETPKIYAAVCKVFQDAGFQTGVIDGYRQGFIHSVGHGLGLSIHEEPSVGSAPRILAPGHLVTLEPGLYYRELGGIRIEDLYWITKRGNQRITKLPHFFEV